MPLNEHVYCVAVAFKMNRATHLHQILHETWTFLCRRYSDLEGHTYWQLVIGSFIRTTRPFIHHVSCRFLAKHQITHMTQPPYTPDLDACNSWLFPKLKSPLKGQTFQRFTKIQQGSWWWLGELCEVPRCLLWRGLRCHCPMYNVSIILRLLQ